MTSRGFGAGQQRSWPLEVCGILQRARRAAVGVVATGAAFSIASLVVFNPTAQAATTWTVTSTKDSPSAECPSATNCTLRKAIGEAQNGDTVVLGAGTYDLEEGELEIPGKAITIKGAGSGATTLTTTAVNRLVEVDNATVTFSGITFSGGVAAPPGGSGGGAMVIVDSTVKISDCAFTNNKAEHANGEFQREGRVGGAILDDGNVTITGTTFADNEAQGGAGTGGEQGQAGLGGAIFHENGDMTLDSDSFVGNIASGASSDPASTGFADGGTGGAIASYGGLLTVKASTFSGNLASGGGTTDSDTQGGFGGDGGAITALGGAVSIAASTIRDNTAGAGEESAGFNSGAGYGGGLVNARSSVTLVSSTVDGNVAAEDPEGFGGSGGGIFSAGATQVSRSTIASNEAPAGEGGGIYDGAPGLAISQSTVGPSNTAASGGGLAVFAPGEAVDSTIANNSATEVGGGLYSTGNHVAFERLFALVSDTVAYNTAQGSPGGGNIFLNDVSLTVRDTLIAAGSDPKGAGNCDLASSTTTVFSEGYDAEDANQCEFTGPGDLVNAGLALGPLQNNGGPTQTIALLAGSAAIEAGDPAGCADGEGNDLPVDQRGVARPQGARCSIGAFEYVPPAPRDSGLALSPSSFAPESRGGSIASAASAHKGTTVHYTDSEAGTSTFEVLRLQNGYRKGRSCKALGNRKRPRHTRACTLETKAGSFNHADATGANTFKFTGRINGRGLSDGSYRLAATPKYYSIAGASTVSTRFKIV